MSATLDQRRASLAGANQVRFARAALKQQLHQRTPADARQLAADTLASEHVPDWLANVAISEYLNWLPRYGRIRARQLCEHEGISETRRLQDLTHRQRANLAIRIH